MEESAVSDMKGVTGVVDMASMYSSTGLSMKQIPNSGNKGPSCSLDKILDNIYDIQMKRGAPRSMGS